MTADAEAGKKARELFLSGLNCAESVLVASMEHLGAKGDWFPRVASGFGSGICLSGRECGAVTGSIMALGWVLGRDDASVKTERLYEVGAELLTDFVDKFGTTACKKLIGVELCDPYERKLAREQGYFEERCAPLVEFCGAWVAGRLDEERKKPA